MSVLNLENAKWLIATLAIPAALGLVAHEYQQSQAERQINDARLRLDALTTENGNPDIDADFSFPDPDPFAPRGRTLTRHLKLWITAHDAPRRRVWAIVDARANQSEKDQRWVFWIDTFDFPMVNFTRVSRSERFTVVLQGYEPETVNAKVRLIYFPSARVGAKDKPFIDDVISDLVHERK